MKKLLLFIFSLVIGFIMLYWVFQTISLEELKRDLDLFKGREGLIILGFSVLTVLLGAWRWKEILRGMGVNLSLKKMMTPFLAGFSIMFLAPVMVWGGEILRAYILKKRNDVPWSKGMGSVIIDRILEWTANVAVILLGGILFISFNSFSLGGVLWVVLPIFVVLLIFLIYFFVKCYKKESILSFIFRGKKNLWDVEKEIFSFFKQGKKAVLKAVLISFLRAAAMYGRVIFLIGFLGKSIGALSAISVLGFSYLAVMIPIPTALGTHEAIQSFAFNSLGLGMSAAPAFTMILRAADLIISLLGVVFLFRVGVIIIKNKILDKIEVLAEED